MTRKVILIAICKKVIWKETAKYLKHYRMKHLGDLVVYNSLVGPLVQLFRDTEIQIKRTNKPISKFEYREMIEKLEKDK